MKDIIFKHYELSFIMFFSCITVVVLIGMDIMFIQPSILFDNFGLASYMIHLGIAVSLISIIRQIKVHKVVTKQHLIKFVTNVLKWTFSVFIVVGLVNEFKLGFYPGGQLGELYKNYISIPYMYIAFGVLLYLYALLFNFPINNIVSLLSDLVGELIFNLFEKGNNKLSKYIFSFKPKRETLDISFDNIKEEAYLVVEPSNKNTHFNIEPNKTVEEVKVEPKIEKVKTRNNLFEDFSAKVESGQLEVENFVDNKVTSGKAIESSDPIVNMLNSAFVNMKLLGINVLPKCFPGPMVTTYELKLPDSMEISKLDNPKKIQDLTRRLKVKTLRLKYNQGGTDHVFLEVPNKTFTTVEFNSNLKKVIPEMLKMNLPMFIGVNTEGHPRVFDLTVFPHMLVAGATNQGKTVGVNAMLSSMLSIKKENEVKLILVDPKLMEFNHYGNSPFLLDLDSMDSDYMEIDDISAPLIEKLRDKIEYVNTGEVVSEEDGLEICPEYDEYQVSDGIVCDMEIVSEILSKLVFIMQVRLLRLKTMRVSKLQEYNEAVDKCNGVHSYTNRKDGTVTERQVKKMPYIVIVIDELADLMEEYSSEVETHIKRLAQKARAAGIHIILCTQRPSVDVVSGTIKANMPVRLAYKLSTSIDAGVVDVSGAEKLLGFGDCIIKTAEEKTRLHGPFIQTDEVSRLSKAVIY